MTLDERQNAYDEFQAALLHLVTDYVKTPIDARVAVGALAARLSALEEYIKKNAD